jgi:predicted dehydrogenase
MLRAAIVGVGFMGWIHYLAYRRSSHAVLAAFCSRDPKKRSGDWRGIQGNFGPPSEQIDMQGLKAYATLDEVLDDPNIDLVDVCLPPNLHVDAVCRSLEAGKDVLCEKPLGLNTADCDRIMEVAQATGRKVMVAQVLAYMGEFLHAYRVANDGSLGRPRHAYFKRIISPPDWIPNFYHPDEIGGPLIDLHVHDTHFVRLLFGMPRRVMCSAKLNSPGGVVQFCQTLMEFDDPTVFVGTTSGVTAQTARPFCHGFELHFEKGAMQYELSALPTGADIMPLKVLGNDGSVSSPDIPAADDISAFTAEIDDTVASLRTGRIDPRLDLQNARDAIHICQCLQQSAENGGEWVACR